MRASRTPHRRCVTISLKLLIERHAVRLRPLLCFDWRSMTRRADGHDGGAAQVRSTGRQGEGDRGWPLHGRPRSDAGANKQLWATITCEHCDCVGRYEITVPDNEVRLDLVGRGQGVA